MKNNHKWLICLVLWALLYTGGGGLLSAQNTAGRVTFISDTSTEYQDTNTWTPAALAWVTDEWPSLADARWIWRSEFVSTEEALNGTPIVTFRRPFTLPADARAISGTIQITADNAYELALNGVVMGADGILDPTGTDTGYTTVESYPLAARPGANELLVRVLSYRDAFGRNDPAVNPAGLIFRAEVTYNANQPPVAADQALTTTQETVSPIALTASDGDNDPLSYKIITEPLHGVLQGAAPNLSYTPQSGFSGADSFTFQANDGTADSNVATVTITVLPKPGSISGQVFFQTQPITNAQITLGGVAYVTDSTGTFHIPAVAEGSYEVIAQALVNETPHATRSEVTVQRNTNSLLNLILQMLPDAQRLIRVDGQQTISGDQTETFPVAESVAIDPDNRTQDLRLVRCVGGKVRLELDLQFQLKSSNDAVAVYGEARLYQGSTCDTTSRKATKTFSVDLANDRSATRLIYLEASEPSGKISADIRLNLVNGRQTLAAVAPVTTAAGGELATSDGRLHIKIPSNAVTQTVTLQYQRRAPAPAPAPDTTARRSVGPPVMVTAQSSLDTAVPKLTRAYTMTLQYSESQVQAQRIDEQTIGLLFWDGTTWVDVLPCPGCGVDPVNNHLTVVLDHFTEFALVGRVTPMELFFPLIAK